MKGGDGIVAQALLPQFSIHVIDADFVEFIYGNGDVDNLVGGTDDLGNAAKNLAVIQLDGNVDVEAVESGNLINLIANNLSFDSSLTGIEIDEGYAYIASAFSDLQGNELVVYRNSCLDYMQLSANVVIGDLDCVIQNGKYLPYEAILKYQNTNVDKSFMIFLVDNDFFNQKDIEDFKKRFKGTIIGLIALDKSLFKKKEKSILIISPKKYKQVDTLATMLPSTKDEIKYKEALVDIKNWLKRF